MPNPSNKPKPLKLTVIGATGGVGQHVVKHALERGHTVTAVARSKDKFEAMMGALGISTPAPKLSFVGASAATVYDKDDKDVKALATAVKGSDVVISCLGNASQKTAADFFLKKAHDVVLNVMKNTWGAPKKLMVISSIGVGDSFEQCKKLSFLFTRVLMPFVITKGIADITAVEELVQAENSSKNGVKTVIVRPCGLEDGAATGEYQRVYADDLDAIPNYFGRVTSLYGLWEQRPYKYSWMGMLPKVDVALAMLHICEDKELFAAHAERPATLLAKRAAIDRTS